MNSNTDFDHGPAHEAHESLTDWMARITGPTGFTRAEVQTAVRTLDDSGFSTADIVQFIAPIAAFAHAWDPPLEPTASTVASVYSLSDASMGAVLDALEDLQEGEPRPPEGEQ